MTRNIRNSVKIALPLIASLTLGPSAGWAHHSFSMFDTDNQITVQGAVKDFQWANPHVWMDVTVSDVAGGQAKVWGMESQSPGILFRRGWKPDSVKAGDKVTVVLHPMKDGTIGGQILKITLPDGRIITTAMNDSQGR